MDNPMDIASEPRDAVQGRTGEFVQMLTGNQSRLYAYICSLVGEAAAARDVLQESNVILWDKAHEYEPARPFLPWAYRVAYLQVLAYRKRCARSRLVFDEQLVSSIAEEYNRRDADHDRQLEALSRCMDKLPGPRRELLDRRYLHGESVDQIAARLRKAPNVVSASLYRIRKALMACIETGLAAE
jgi:RNA polymerase sigma-70 factor, ECF subfamily